MIFRVQRSNYGLIDVLADAVTVVTISLSALVWAEQTTFMETWEFFRTINDDVFTSYDILENV